MFFGDKLKPKGDDKSQIPKFELSYFSFNFHAVFLQNDNLDGLLMDHKKISSKRDLNSQMFSHIWKAYIFNTYLKQVKCQIQQVQHITVSKVVFNINVHLFSFPLSTCCGLIML